MGLKKEKKAQAHVDNSFLVPEGIKWENQDIEEVRISENQKRVGISEFFFFMSSEGCPNGGPPTSYPT